MELCELESKTNLVIFFLSLQVESLQDLNTRFVKEAENEVNIKHQIPKNVYGQIQPRISDHQSRK